MSFKDILVHVDSTPASGVRLRLGLALARRFGARLSGLHVLPDPDVPPYFKPSAVERIAKIYRESAREAASLAEAGFHAAIMGADVETAWNSVAGDMAQQLAERARFADLLLLGQSDTENPPSLSAFSIPQKVVIDAGTPILVVPTRGAFDTTGRHVLVTWDGSREAARAVRDAMPFLQAAEHVSLLAVDPERQGHIHPTANAGELAAHLARHGVATDPTTIASAEESVADVLLANTRKLGADLLVMGGYGHPRLLELVLGGTTQALLEAMAVPILVSH
ncbi:MAG TPA: universal stress protein [Candidatus Cybelea sp.]|nr:universal stress protein [Candidatus Cybelea sp.]